MKKRHKDIFYTLSKWGGAVTAISAMLGALSFVGSSIDSRYAKAWQPISLQKEMQDLRNRVEKLENKK